MPRRNPKVIGNRRLWRTPEDFGPARPDNGGPRRVATVGESLGQVLARSATNPLSRPPRIPKIAGITAGTKTRGRPKFRFPGDGIGIGIGDDDLFQLRISRIIRI